MTDLTDFPLATKVCLREEIARYGWRIGDYSYGAPLIFDFGHLVIGRFCSIAVGVSLILGSHRMDRVSTYPFKLLGDFFDDMAQIPEDRETCGSIDIGSDVWLGAHCVVLNGLRIGSGAVVGAGSVVTRDVPPYAVVAGNPARLLRYRCTQPQIAALLALAWWDWPDERIRTELPSMAALSVDAFIARYGPPG